MNPETGIAERSRPNRSRQQPEACGRCHARRSVIAAIYEYGRPLADTHMIVLLDENLYHSDGCIQDEAYRVTNQTLGANAASARTAYSESCVLTDFTVTHRLFF